MNASFSLGDRQISLNVERRARRSVEISVTGEAALRILMPASMAEHELHAILNRKREWIVRQLEKRTRFFTTYSADQLAEDMKRLLPPWTEFVQRRVHELAAPMAVSPRALRLKPYKSLWGSCSAQGVISINSLLCCCPDEITEYVIVHELAHLTHRDHSPAFWARVTEFDPDHREHRRYLRKEASLLTTLL